MDELIGEIGRGFLRGIGYILAEIFFGTICYWTGWPICKLITLGRYPSPKQTVYLDSYNGNSHGFWCSATGLVVIVIASLFATRQF